MSRRRSILAALAIGLTTLSVGCTRPDIRYYQLAVDQEILQPSTERSNVVFSVESMIGDSAYEDPRIVYRKSPYRIDYYHYHRWSSPPGVMVSDFLRDAYEQSGYFDSVAAGFSPDSTVFLSGRLIAFEEVDRGNRDWYARVKMNLLLRNSQDGKVVWTRTIEKEEEVDQLDPEGVARAMSRAMTEIVSETAPELAKIAAAEEEKVRRRRNRDDVLDQLGDQPAP